MKITCPIGGEHEACDNCKKPFPSIPVYKVPTHGEDYGWRFFVAPDREIVLCVACRLVNENMLLEWIDGT